MIEKSIRAYRLSIFEHSLLIRVEKTFLSSDYKFERWPEIYYGNFKDFDQVLTTEKKQAIPEKDYNLYDPDYLGLYVYADNTEGHIRIFKDRIRECAKEISSSLNLDISNVFDILKAIVLIHEYGHWMTHWCHKINEDHRRNNFKHISKITVETLAQLCIVWSLKKFKKKEISQFKLVFDYLVSLQSREYQEFLLFGKKQNYNNSILIRFSHIIDKGLSSDYLFYGKNFIKH